MFNFDNVEVQAGFEQKYMNQGSQVVTFSEITNGLSSQKQSPFIKITCTNKEGLTCSSDFYLNEGKAFNISANTFFKYIAYANNLDLATDEGKVKGMLAGATSAEQVASKLSTALVGKSVAMVIKGEWVNPQDMSKKSWVKSVLSNLVAKTSDVGKLTYDSTKHIKGNMDVREANGNMNSTASKPGAVNW